MALNEVNLSSVEQAFLAGSMCFKESTPASDLAGRATDLALFEYGLWQCLKDHTGIDEL